MAAQYVRWNGVSKMKMSRLHRLSEIDPNKSWKDAWEKQDSDMHPQVNARNLCSLGYTRRKVPQKREGQTNDEAP